MFNQLFDWLQFGATPSPSNVSKNTLYLDRLDTRLRLLDQTRLQAQRLELRALRRHFLSPNLRPLPTGNDGSANEAEHTRYRELRSQYFFEYQDHLLRVLVAMTERVTRREYAEWLLLDDVEKDLIFPWIENQSRARRREILRAYALYLNLTRVVCVGCYQGPLLFQRHLHKARVACAQHGVRLEDLVASPKLARALTLLGG